MGVMEVLTALLTITLPIIATVVLTNCQTQRIIQNSNSQTQRIIRTSNRQTQRILKKLERCLVEISHTQRDIQKVQRDTNRLLKKMHRCLLKLDFGFEASAAMHGWRREDNVAPERAAELPEPKVYNHELRICYYRAAS
jgi:hypothetical protein